MMIAKFSEAFSRKGSAKREALALVKKQFPGADFLGSYALVDSLDPHTPGVSEFGEAFVAEPTIEGIKKAALECAGPLEKFWLDVERKGNHDFTSMDVARQVGRFIEENGKEATMSGTFIRVLVRQKKAVAFIARKGPGGLPMGLFGKAVFLWEKNYRSELALLKLAGRGFEPVVVCPEGEKPCCGVPAFHAPIREVTGHALKGFEGPLTKSFLYRLGGIVMKRTGARLIASGEILGSQLSEDPVLLKRVESFTGVHPERPIGFYSMSQARNEAKELGIPVEERHQSWRRFKERELEQEWLSLEMEKVLDAATESISS